MKLKQLNIKTLSIHFSILVVLACSLSSCIFVVGAAAGAAAITVIHDHRTLHDRVGDMKLASRINDKIMSVKALREDSHINVTVFNHVVLLTGETPNEKLRKIAGMFAQTTPGAARIYNEITPNGGNSSALTLTSDTWITTKIKSEMIATKDLRSSSIKVVTENGTVYLMGIVTHEQADIAVDIARQVSGVQRVIKIFQY